MKAFHKVHACNTCLRNNHAVSKCNGKLLFLNKNCINLSHFLPKRPSLYAQNKVTKIFFSSFLKIAKSIASTPHTRKKVFVHSPPPVYQSVVFCQISGLLEALKRFCWPGFRNYEQWDLAWKLSLRRLGFHGLGVSSDGFFCYFVLIRNCRNQNSLDSP